MTPEIYGKRKQSTFLPEFYNQSTVLEIKRKDDECPIAWGRWIKLNDMDYPIFELHSGSYITIDDKFEGEPDITNIKQELLDNELLLDTGNKYYEVLQTIYFHYPSTAGKLVQGHHCNGYVDWKTEDGITLDDMLNL